MRYNGDDERVEVKIGTATPRRFVYDEDGRLIGEYGATVATLGAEHVWLMPEVAEGGYEPLALVGPTTTSWVHGDHLGTPVMIADRHYNMHRDYDPTVGRNVQADPIGLAGGDNICAYVGGIRQTG